MTTQFELSAYGVEEMNKKEMIEIDGGFWLSVGIIGLVLVYIGGETISYYLNGDNSMIYIPDGGTVDQTGTNEFTVSAPPGFYFCGPTGTFVRMEN